MVNLYCEIEHAHFFLNRIVRLMLMNAFRCFGGRSWDLCAR